MKQLSEEISKLEAEYPEDASWGKSVPVPRPEVAVIQTPESKSPAAMTAPGKPATYEAKPSPTNQDLPPAVLHEPQVRRPVEPVRSTPIPEPPREPLNARSSNVDSASHLLVDPANTEQQQSGAQRKKYIEAGSFKEILWAERASDSLADLGFKTTVFHKTRLWMDSYQVLVGPYVSQAEIASARQTLEGLGFRSRLRNAD